MLVGYYHIPNEYSSPVSKQRKSRRKQLVPSSSLDACSADLAWGLSTKDEAFLQQEGLSGQNQKIWKHCFYFAAGAAMSFQECYNDAFLWHARSKNCKHLALHENLLKIGRLGAWMSLMDCTWGISIYSNT
eukprot:TRINITY_DN16365_c0_g2_i1.p1 TRINITY_DN16365_c0_g2~~TRINITY_DN16365_c0_g2_i1.p1  ORF type:complete len:131 (+),score=25.50 TRINITY_DN16365_c0_g2_i1:148-540(+)